MADDDGCVSGGELGLLIDLHERQVRKLAERGVIERSSRGRFEPGPCIVRYIRHLREEAAGRAASASDDGSPDLVLERALLAREQREAQAMRNAVQRGELLPIEDVEEVAGSVLDAVRTKHLALPTKAAPLLVGVTSLVEAREILTRLVHDALTDLASTSVVVAAAADRARRSLGRSRAGDAAAASAAAAPAADGQRMGRRP